jgi:hypothetical protein
MKFTFGRFQALGANGPCQATGKAEHVRFVFNFFDELRRRIPSER